MKYTVFIILFILYIAQAQDSLTLENIFINGKFDVTSVSQDIHWLNTPYQYYTADYDAAGNPAIVVKNILNKKKISTLATMRQLTPRGSEVPISIEEMTMSSDGKYILIQSKSVPVYRRSRHALYYYFNTKNKKLTPLHDSTMVINAQFSPDGQKIAYTLDNNLYYYEIEKNTHIQLTTDGKKNEIINGQSDWVYEEEFEFTKAYFWSPDSKYLAYYRFDESKVKQYTMQMWQGQLYPQNYTYKYPKAGEANAKVKILVQNISNNAVRTAFDASAYDNYIPRLMWTNTSEILSIQELNRTQDTLQILHYNTTKNTCDTVLQVTDPAYVEIDDNMIYTDSSIIFTNETSGYRHIYSFDYVNKKYTQLTKGGFEVSGILYYDSAKKYLYYSSKEVHSTYGSIFVIDLQNNKKIPLCTTPGIYDADFHPSGQYAMLTHQSAEQPLSTYLLKAHNQKILPLYDNKLHKAAIDSMKLPQLSYDTFINNDNDTLNYWMIKPANYNTKKNPLLLFVYGGPGSQAVLNTWYDKKMYWHQYLASKGYVVACLDNRGTGGKGAYLKKCTTYKLGKLEAEDQIQFAKYLSNESYIDASRIGIWGWSFGGYLSTLCLLLGNDIFKAAIAVAPVTSWRLYDTIYTERFLKNPTDNAKGYDEYSPLTHAHRLKGNYLLIHGTADDNVHYQNTIEMQRMLIKEGKQFNAFTYPDKAHGISGATTRYHLFRQMTEYLFKNL
ncbi:MAG: S9 family peptidase [Cytophagales bacterium]|nr:S9 family peptidase [Cytophagales bacterium]